MFLRKIVRLSSPLVRSFSSYKASMEDLKSLRNLTSAPINDCKKALEEHKGDMNKALEYLRKKGLA